MSTKNLKRKATVRAAHVCIVLRLHVNISMIERSRTERYGEKYTSRRLINEKIIRRSSAVDNVYQRNRHLRSVALFFSFHRLQPPEYRFPSTDRNCVYTVCRDNDICRASLGNHNNTARTAHVRVAAIPCGVPGNAPLRDRSSSEGSRGMHALAWCIRSRQTLLGTT